MSSFPAIAASVVGSVLAAEHTRPRQALPTMPSNEDRRGRDGWRFRDQASALCRVGGCGLQVVRNRSGASNNKALIESTIHASVIFFVVVFSLDVLFLLTGDR
jgi:hypothetical protein